MEGEIAILWKMDHDVIIIIVLQGLVVILQHHLRVLVLFCRMEHIALEMKTYCITVDTLNVHYYHNQIVTIP